MPITNKLIQDFYLYISKIDQSHYNFKLNKEHINIEKQLKINLSEDLLVNFRNNILTNFLGAITFPDKHLGSFLSRGIIKHYLASVLLLFKNKKKYIKYCRILDLKYLDNKENRVGNPILYFNETSVNITNNFYYSVIQKFLKNIKYKRILEVGGGFGKLCSIF